MFIIIQIYLNLLSGAKQDGEDLSRYRFVILDGLWNQLNQADKIKYFYYYQSLMQK